MRPKNFLTDNQGTVTVEAVIWVPIYLLFFGLIADVSMLFHSQARAMRIAYDGNRQASLGVHETEKAVEDAILARISSFSPSGKVDTTFGTNAVETTVTMPANELTVIGTFTTFLKLDITVSSAHLLEV